MQNRPELISFLMFSFCVPSNFVYADGFDPSKFFEPMIEARLAIPRVSMVVQSTTFDKNGLPTAYTLSRREEIVEGDRLFRREVSADLDSKAGSITPDDNIRIHVNDVDKGMLYVSRENMAARWPGDMRIKVNAMFEQYVKQYDMQQVRLPENESTPRLIVMQGAAKGQSQKRIYVVFSPDGILLTEMVFSAEGRLEKLTTVSEIDRKAEIEVSGLTRGIPLDAVIKDKKPGQGFGIQKSGGATTK